MSKKSRHSWTWHVPEDGMRRCDKCGKVSTTKSHSGMRDCTPNKEMKDNG